MKRLQKPLTAIVNSKKLSLFIHILQSIVVSCPKIKCRERLALYRVKDVDLPYPAVELIFDKFFALNIEHAGWAAIWKVFTVYKISKN